MAIVCTRHAQQLKISQFEHARFFPRSPLIYKLEQDIFTYSQSMDVMQQFDSKVKGKSMQIRTKDALVRSVFLFMIWTHCLLFNLIGNTEQSSEMPRLSTSDRSKTSNQKKSIQFSFSQRSLDLKAQTVGVH